MNGRDDDSGTRRARQLYVASAVVPLVPAAGSVADALPPDWAVTAALVRSVTPDALLYTAWCVVAAAPLAGVALASGSGQRGGDAARRMLIGAAIFSAVSAALTLMRLGTGGDALRLVATSHGVLASVTVALGALGVLSARLFRDPLDAGAVALGLAATAGFGVLVAGAPVGALPQSALNAAVLASPIMTIASAAHVDLVRTDIWYQVSPLAHVQVEYPAWTTACAAYLGAGGVAFLTSGVVERVRPHAAAGRRL